MPNVKLLRIGVGAVPGAATLECIDPQVPYNVVMRDTDTGEFYNTSLCADPVHGPCDEAGLMTLLETAGYVFVDGGCP